MRGNRAIFIASFLTLIAAGMGFGVRGGILANWSAQFGFTQLELGLITGGGLIGFGVVILIASMILDLIGYKPVMFIAFVLHVLSAIVTVAATPVFEVTESKTITFYCLWIGMFMFAVGNGLCEAAINPLTATLYPDQKTHYLNILHAGWPGGLIVGGAIIAARNAFFSNARWEILICLFLAPTLIYGVITLINRFPISEARAAGVSYMQMLLSLLSPLLLFLFLLHACVGYVELGTDSWIQNITGSIVTWQAALMFIWTSSIMFVLRFFAGPIVKLINPLGLLLASAALATIGLLAIGFSGLLSYGGTTLFWSAVLIWIAVTIYGVGKTFFWPTMLGVVGEKFPKGGAITMGFIGGIGMLSAGLLGGPGIGYKQDYYASAELQAKSTATFQRYAADNPNSFLFFPAVKGLNGRKVAVVLDDGKTLAKEVEILKRDDRLENVKAIKSLNEWWSQAKDYSQQDKSKVDKAVVFGGSMAMILTAGVPFFMGIGYLALVVYFLITGGYKVESLSAKEESETDDLGWKAVPPIGADLPPDDRIKPGPDDHITTDPDPGPPPENDQREADDRDK